MELLIVMDPITLQRLLIPAVSTSSIRVCIGSGVSVCEVHATLSVLFCYLNPLLIPGHLRTPYPIGARGCVR